MMMMMTAMMMTQRNFVISFVNQFPRQVTSFNHSCRLFLVWQYEPILIEYRKEKNAFIRTPACLAGKYGKSTKGQNYTKVIHLLGGKDLTRDPVIFLGNRSNNNKSSLIKNNTFLLVVRLQQQRKRTE